jgi:four helix bundle suffix protein
MKRDNKVEREKNTDGHGGERTRTDTDRHGQARIWRDSLIPKHGGYHNLKTFQISELIYDVTVRFCDKFIEKRSRTHDQMVQAARSGRQNIAEGSMDSATSKKIEMKLTGIARGSLEELKLDYEDYLRQRSLPQWPPENPTLIRFKALKCSSLDEFRAWVADEVKKEKENTDTKRRTDTDEHGGERTRTITDSHGQTRTKNTGTSPSDVRVSPCQSVSNRPCPSVLSGRAVPLNVFPAVLAANGALSLLNLCIYLLDRQLESQASSFEKEGGFTERLYRRRIESRRGGSY